MAGQIRDEGSGGNCLQAMCKSALIDVPSPRVAEDGEDQEVLS